MDIELANTLLTMARADQKYREQWFTKRDEPSYRVGQQQMDKQHAARLRKIIAEYGWPGKKLVGAEASHAAWLVAQHADIELQEQCLELMKSMPENENDPRQAAYLTDKICVRHGQPQLYGTQYTKQDGELRLAEVEDPEGLDTRRHKIGLPPASYLYDFAAAERADKEGTAFSSLGGWRS
jgi:hypothetical protein